jgi:hypothetical protein
MITRIFKESTVTRRNSLTKGSPPGILKIVNPPSPPGQRATFGFRKGGMGGFETYFLGNGYEDTVYPL